LLSSMAKKERVKRKVGGRVTAERLIINI
jgi:hypothetical protein